jgi:hypothetical protein
MVTVGVTGRLTVGTPTGDSLAGVFVGELVGIRGGSFVSAGSLSDG